MFARHPTNAELNSYRPKSNSVDLSSATVEDIKQLVDFIQKSSLQSTSKNHEMELCIKDQHFTIQRKPKVETKKNPVAKKPFKTGNTSLLYKSRRMRSENSAPIQAVENIKKQNSKLGKISLGIVYISAMLLVMFLAFKMIIHSDAKSSSSQRVQQTFVNTAIKHQGGVGGITF